MSFRVRFRCAAGLWIALVAGLLLSGPALLGGRLPARVATHWGLSGRPDRSMPVAQFTTMLLIVWAAIALVGLGFLLRGGIMRKHQRFGSGATLSAGGLFVLGAMALIVWAHGDATDWSETRSVSWQFLPLLAGCALAGWLGGRLAGAGPDQRAHRLDAEHVVRWPKAGERLEWVSVASSTPLRVVALLPVFGLALGLGSFLVSGELTMDAAAFVISFVALGLIALALSSVRVQAGEQGVRIAFGPQRWPTRRIPLKRIERARVANRRPILLGGWGLRGLPGRTTIMIRGGECLILEYRSGGQLGISVDDAERGAALINALVTEHAALAEGIS